MKRLPAQILHYPEANRLPEYFGLPEVWFHSLLIAALALWALAGFSRQMALVVGALGLAAGSFLGSLARKDAQLPWRRVRAVLHYAQSYPAVTEWSLRS